MIFFEDLEEFGDQITSDVSAQFRWWLSGDWYPWFSSDSIASYSEPVSSVLVRSSASPNVEVPPPKSKQEIEENWEFV